MKERPYSWNIIPFSVADIGLGFGAGFGNTKLNRDLRAYRELIKYVAW